MKPQITVLMPVHNGAAYLKEALQSLWSQTFRSFELWVFDNGSTDETPALLAEEAGSSAAAGRMKWERLKENQGISRTMNEGIRRARGTWIARMDADDVCLPQRLDMQQSFLKASPEIALCGTWAKIFGNGRSVRHQPVVKPDTVRSMFAFQNPLVHSSVMWNRGQLMVKDLWYDESLAAAQDMELWYRCAEKTGVCNIPKQGIHYRAHQGSVSNLRASASLAVRTAVVERALSFLGDHRKDLDMEMHLQLGTAGSFSDVDRLEKAGEQLVWLVEANSDLHGYPAQAFGEAAAWCWDRCCLNSAQAGIGVLRIWKAIAKELPRPKTPLSSGVPVSATLLVSSGLKSFRSMGT